MRSREVNLCSDLTLEVCYKTSANKILHFTALSNAFEYAILRFDAGVAVVIWGRAPLRELSACREIGLIPSFGMNQN